MTSGPDPSAKQSSARLMAGILVRFASRSPLRRSLKRNPCFHCNQGNWSLFPNFQRSFSPHLRVFVCCRTLNPSQATLPTGLLCLLLDHSLVERSCPRVRFPGSFVLFVYYLNRLWSGAFTNLEFLDEINLCLQKARGIKNLMKRLEVALKSLSKDDYCEITHAAMQDLNELLKGLINTWDLWSSGVSIELDRLNKLEQQNKKTKRGKL